MNGIQDVKSMLDGVAVEHIPMGRMISRVRDKGKDFRDIETVYSVSNVHGLIRADEYRDNAIHSEDTSNYTVVRCGMFAYNPARLNIGSIAYLKDDAAAGLVSPMYVVFSLDETLISKEYLGHFLKSGSCVNRINSLTEEGARFRFDFERWSLIDVPVPSLEVQKRIVRALDAFNELTVELTSELAARTKQYEHYRKRLLTFEDGCIPSKTLDELAESIASGKNKVRTPEGTIPVYGSTGLIGFTDKPGYSGDVLLVARVGANAGRVNAASGRFDVSDNTIVVRPRIEWNIRFAFHQLADMNLNQYAVGGGQPLVTGGLLKGLRVPFPSMIDQERIAGILDKFHVFITSLTDGLPREIELRQSQYEYYRDLLFSFPKSEEVKV